MLRAQRTRGSKRNAQDGCRDESSYLSVTLCVHVDAFGEESIETESQPSAKRE